MRINPLEFSAILFTFTSIVYGQMIINNSYKRSVYFTGSIVREEHLIDLEVADETSKPASGMPEDLATELHQNWFPNYVFLVPADQADNAVSWDASLVSNPSQFGTNPLTITDITLEVPTCQK